MKKKLRILMLEDIEEDAGLIDRVLDKENIPFTRIRVDTRRAFTDALNDFNPDVILSDHALPEFNSIEALKICKQRKIDTPFILVTGAVSEEFAVNCLRYGAYDYILKTNLSRLPMAIQYAVRQHQFEIDRLKQGARLRERNEQLHKVNKELDSFVYSISHNLRSPLSSVLGLINVAKLDRQKDIDSSSYYFQLIEESILKLDKTLQEILDYSQNIRTELEISEVNMEMLVSECLEQVKYLRGIDDVVKLVEVKQETPFYSDAHRLSIIFSNLISNAIRYRDPAKKNKILKIVVTINPAFARIILRDNGVGIAPAHLSSVFNMFFRASEKSEGAGLGLYIVKEMIGKLNGTVTLTSVIGEETEVTLTVPNKLLTA